MKVQLNITVEVDFDDDYPLATSLDDCHTIGGKSATDLLYGLANKIMDSHIPPRYILDGEYRLGSGAGYDKRLDGEVTSVTIEAGENGELGFARVSNEDVRTGLFITITEAS